MSQDNEQTNSPLGRKLSEFKDFSEDDPNELLKYGFLCREGILGLYGQTGIGKSSISMQCKIQWALGREAFGIKPKQPLTSLLIQAENDDRDIAAMRNGVCAGLGLTDEEKQQAWDNIIVIHEDSRVGKHFFDEIVNLALAEYKPDLLWIDPALAYLGGDTLSQKDVTIFLRNWLKPLLKVHRCGCVVVHHTNKTGKNDSAYSGSGSAEWGNMPRAILTLSEKQNGIFELLATKRNKNLRWKMPDGISFRNSLLLKHSIIDGQIFWLEVAAADIAITQKTIKKQDQENEILQRIPQEGSIEKDELVMLVNRETGIGLNALKKLVTIMIGSGKISPLEFRRQNARPAIYLGRPPDKPDTVKQP